MRSPMYRNGLSHKLRVACLIARMAIDRADAATTQLEICRRMLNDALVDIERLREDKARLGRQLLLADSKHLCAGQTRRCYTQSADVLVDAGEGEYNA